jgi:hypothetical protein
LGTHTIHLVEKFRQETFGRSRIDRMIILKIKFNRTWKYGMDVSGSGYIRTGLVQKILPSIPLIPGI